RSARRPKLTKLALNTTLRTYVEERLAPWSLALGLGPTSLSAPAIQRFVVQQAPSRSATASSHNWAS
ncbi:MULTISPECIES: hypothetical protein, partial [unclassified Bradyrhizobium]|uniref:hypothetical protein n=1 Tax=unclassified Bradyrhizobium TaxID=2631580 RepID=UPI0029168BE2